MRSGMDLFEIGSTDAAGMDTHQDFAGFDFRDRYCLYADIVHATIDGCPHDCGDGEVFFLYRIGYCCCHIFLKRSLQALGNQRLQQ